MLQDVFTKEKFFFATSTAASIYVASAHGVDICSKAHMHDAAKLLGLGIGVAMVAEGFFRLLRNHQQLFDSSFDNKISVVFGAHIVLQIILIPRSAFVYSLGYLGMQTGSFIGREVLRWR